MIKNKKLISGVAFLVVLLPVLAFAQISGLPVQITSVTEASTRLGTIVGFFVILFWVLTVAMLIWAAIIYLTAGGDEDKLKEAKSRIIYALIAAAIALLSTSLQSIVTNLISGTS